MWTLYVHIRLLIKQMDFDICLLRCWMLSVTATAESSSNQIHCFISPRVYVEFIAFIHYYDGFRIHCYQITTRGVRVIPFHSLAQLVQMSQYGNKQQANLDRITVWGNYCFHHLWQLLSFVVSLNFNTVVLCSPRVPMGNEQNIKTS